MKHFTPDFTPVHMYELGMAIDGTEYYRATLPEDEAIAVLSDYDIITKKDLPLPLSLHFRNGHEEWFINRKPDEVISDQIVAQFPFNDNTGIKKYTGHRSFMKDTITVVFYKGAFTFKIPNLKVVEDESEFCDDVFEYVKYVMDGKHYRLEYNGQVFDTMDDVFRQVAKDTMRTEDD